MTTGVTVSSPSLASWFLDENLDEWYRHLRGICLMSDIFVRRGMYFTFVLPEENSVKGKVSLRGSKGDFLT